MTDYDKFKAACERWRLKFGLMDWLVTYESERRDPEYGARIFTDASCRHALVKYNLNRVLGRRGLDVLARHEILHLLFTDYGIMCARRGDHLHDDVMREEHKIIERIIGLLH